VACVLCAVGIRLAACVLFAVQSETSGMCVVCSVVSHSALHTTHMPLDSLYTAHNTHTALQSHSALHRTHMPLGSLCTAHNTHDASLTLHCTQQTRRSKVSLCISHNTHAALHSHSALHTKPMTPYSLTLHCTQHTRR